MTRTAFALVGTLLGLAIAAPSHATLNTCAAAKKLCVAKKTAALLKCHSKNEKPPAGLAPAKFAACLQKAKDKFDGGTNPAKGCFAKLEAKYGIGCLTSGDTAALEAKVDAYVDDVVCALDSGGGTCPTPTATPTPAPTSTPSCFANGQSCAIGGQCCSTSCMGGVCQPSCVNGFQDGNETDVDCGGSDCPDCGLGGGCLANSDCIATTVCSGGQCVCNGGLSDCNANPGDGCEVSVGNDPNNCGACGAVCSLANATEGCNMSMCFITSCFMPFANCNGITADGCEINTQTNAAHCGACGAPCGMGQSCVSGVCM